MAMALYNESEKPANLTVRSANWNFYGFIIIPALPEMISVCKVLHHCSSRNVKNASAICSFLSKSYITRSNGRLYPSPLWSCTISPITEGCKLCKAVSVKVSVRFSKEDTMETVSSVVHSLPRVKWYTFSWMEGWSSGECFSLPMFIEKR